MNYIRVTCPICGEDNCELVLDRECQRGQVYLSICKNDGMVYLNPRWAPEKYAEFYQKRYYETHIKGGSRVGIQQLCIRRSFEFLSTQENLVMLDIGAGRGELFEACQYEGISAKEKDAIEADPAYRKVLVKNGINVIAKDVDSDWHIGRENRYDFIVMRHVLEHFLNPGSVLKKVNSVLTETGVLYLEVPNIMQFSRERSAYTHFEPAHPYYFSMRTLEKVTKQAGLRWVDSVHSSIEISGVYIKGKKPEGEVPIYSTYHKQLAILKEFINK